MVAGFQKVVVTKSYSKAKIGYDVSGKKGDDSEVAKMRS